MRRRWLAAIVLSTGLVLVAGARAHADEADQRPLERIKQHEQELEKKIQVERERPDKKAHAKKVVDHIEDNIRELGTQIKSAGHEVRAGAQKDDKKRGDKKKLGPKATEKKAETTTPKKLPDKSQTAD